MTNEKIMFNQMLNDYHTKIITKDGFVGTQHEFDISRKYRKKYRKIYNNSNEGTPMSGAEYGGLCVEDVIPEEWTF